MEKYTGLEIAVIGLAGRFPEADNVAQFWENLKNGRDSISQLSDEEILEEGESEATLNDPLYVKSNAYLKSKKYFDAAFFNYRPDEAELMDPQTRIFHECCWEALEDSGYVSSQENKIGVFAAGTPNVPWVLQAENRNREGLVDNFTATQLRDVSFLCSRIAYKFNFKGPAIYIQTACSSSLVAIHEACNSLLLGECSIALAGGVHVQHYSSKGYIYKEGMIRSRDGKCRPFDVQSNGTVNGEGAGVVVLKKLKDAIHDGDNIYAIIKGTAINNDGNSKVGYTAPSVKGQAEVIKKALRMARIESESITYVETHGTATELGDPIEIEALNTVFGWHKEKICAIGAVKSNIGHLDSAAGVAGFIKTVLAIKNKQIPPTIHFNKPNPKIDFNGGPFFVNERLTDWKNSSGPLRAGVSSFGIGGTNAHMILEEAPLTHESTESRAHQLILLSAKTKTSLAENTNRLIQFLETNSKAGLPDVSYTLQSGRERFKYRKMLVCENTGEAIRILSDNKATEDTSSIAQEELQNIVFMFSGQGAQYSNMCRDLYEKEKLFRDILNDCLQRIKQFSDLDFHSILFTENAYPFEKDISINNTKYTQPLLFMVEYSLCQLLMKWGIKPDYMIGHSIGEYVAACISGVLSLDDALRLVTRRGALMSRVERGCMLAINLNEDQLQSYLSENNRIDLAVINTETSLVVAGKETDIVAFEKLISEQGFQCKRLHTSHAFHSYMMDDILDEFEDEFSTIKIHEPAIPYISNIDGTFVNYEQIKEPSYWSRHLRSTVQFLKGTESLLAKGNAIFIEIGPGRTLCNYVAGHKSKNQGHHVVNTIRQAKQQIDDQKYLIEKFGFLWLKGLKIDWKEFYASERRTRVSLPAYAFDRVAYTADFDVNKFLYTPSTRDAFLIKRSIDQYINTSSWKRTISPNKASELTAHTYDFIIFCGKEHFSNELIRHLRSLQHRVVEVRPASASKCISTHLYELDFSNPNDFTELWKSVALSGVSVTEIIYCVTLDDSPEDIKYESIRERLRDGYLGVSYIAKCIAEDTSPRNINFTIVSNYLAEIMEDEEVDPLKSAIHAPVKIMPSEIANIRCKVIDIPYPFQTEKELNEYITKVEDEICFETQEPFVAYRYKQRWIQGFDTLIPDGKTASNIEIVEKGTYIITGGFGGIGFSIAKDLVNRHGANVVLVYRSDFPEREDWADWLKTKSKEDPISKKIVQVMGMESTGCKVDLYQVDVAVEKQVDNFANEIKTKYPKINGLIWSAGEVDYGGIILNRTKDDFIKYASSKIHGLLLFEKYLGFGSLDFLALFSSVGNVIYQVKFGQVGYNTGNEFLEHYAHYARKKLGIHAFTINWCDWLDVGLTVKAVMREQKTEDINLINSRINHAIYPSEGINIFYKCLAGKAPVYSIYKEDLCQAILDRRSELNELRKIKNQAEGVSGPSIANVDLKASLVEIYAGFFGRDDVGVDNDFFELGGDSLKAMSLVARLNQKMGINLSISDLYRYPTINDMLLKLQDEALDHSFTAIPNAPLQSLYLASSEQKRMYFLQMLDEDSIIYNETELLWAQGELDRKKVERVFTQLIERHEGLRTSFVFKDEKLWQCIASEFDFKVEYLEYDEQKVDEIIQSFIKPFHLNSTPLLRVGIIEKGPGEHLMVIDSHHIVMDGVSRLVLRDEFNALYNDEELPALHLQYKDYAEWQQSGEQQELISKQKDFWINEFSGDQPLLELPADFPKPTNRNYTGDCLRWEVGTDLTKKLRSIAASDGTTVFTVLLSIFNILLSRLRNEEDIVIGIPVAGRQHADLERIIGMFVNTLALRNYPKAEMSFKDFLSDVKARSLAAFENQAFQFEELVNELKIGRDTDTNPLFNVMFVYQNYEESKHKTRGLTIKPANIRHTLSRFDITLLAVEQDNQVFLRFIFSTELFRTETISRFIGYFQKIVSAVADNAGTRIADIEIISEQEKQQLLFDFNPAKTEYDVGKTVIDLFREQVKKTPDNIALVYGNQKLSYHQLDDKSIAIAHQINARLQGHGHRIALLFHTSVEMIASLLAVMRTGCTFVPLSPEVPDERNRYILQDSGASLLLIQDELYNEKRSGILFNEADEIIVVSDTQPTIEGTLFSEKKISSESLVYIIYTSGTTGRPKGVEIKHSSLVNYVLWNKAYHNLSKDDVTLQLISYHFDGFGANTYPVLLSGGTLVMVPEEYKLDADYIIDVIRTENVTNFALLPGLYGALLDRLASVEEPVNLRFVVLGGEKASRMLVEKHVSILPGLMLENEYGPTETSIAATHHRPVNAEHIGVIGTPIWNTSIYILGKRNELLPVGVKGEICISGEGLARGYVNNELLTLEKFVANPFVPHQRIYKTGDLGKWQPDGTIEISGRLDDQVKMRGYRIELSEIECQLLQYNDITQTVILVYEKEEDKYLVAYYISEKEIGVDALKAFLSDKLPEYMVPAYYMRLKEFPYALTGKLDKKAFPIPAIGTDDDYVAPKTKEEKLLVRVWSEVLGVEKIGTTANFFSIGGDSIKSIQICSRLRTAGCEVSVKDIFNSQTIKQLATRLKESVTTSDQSLVTGWIPLTPIQRWFFEKYTKAKHHFNQSVMLHFADGISKDTVHAIFLKLQEHHDSLRMVFKEEANEILQQNKASDLPLSLKEYDLTEEEDPLNALCSISNAMEEDIDLENGPLMKLGLFQMDKGSHLLIVIHHLVVDGISWRILFEDIETLYQQKIKNLPLALPLKTDSYQRWAQYLLGYTQSRYFGRAKPYWQNMLDKDIFALRRDFPDGSNTFGNVCTESFQLSKNNTAELLKEVHASFNTHINDILLSALLLSFEKQYGTYSLMIDLEGHGRENGKQEINISRTVGWFTNMYPVILEKTTDDLSAMIKEIKETLRKVPNNGIDYLLLKYLNADEQGIRDGKSSKISFNYLGQFDTDIRNRSFTIANQITRNDISPKEIRDYDWDISGIITGGQLSMQISYSNQQYKKDTVQKVLNLYKESLLEVINYCCTYGKTELTPSDLTFKNLSVRELDELNDQYDLEDIYPLSPMQEGMLFHSLLDSDSNNYFQQMSYMLKGRLDIEAIEKSMNDLIARYKVLRSVFLHKGYERPIQIILKERKIDFEYRDIRQECLNTTREEVIGRYQEQDRSKTFDLSKDVLMRLLVLRTALEEFEFIWSHHHVLMDGWCMSIIVNEFSRIYSVNKRGQEVVLPPVNPYSNYIGWLEGRDKQESASYWTDYLKGYEQLATLPKKEVAAAKLTFKLASSELVISDEQTAALHKVSKKCGVTINTILQSVWGIVLGKYNNVNDVVFGSVVSGRPAEINGIETMVGLFINTIPVRIRYAAGDSFYDLMRRVQEGTLKSEQYQYQPLFEVQSLSELGRELLDHIIVFEDYPMADEIKSTAGGNNEQKDYVVTNVQVFEQANYDVMLVVIPGDTIQIRIDYNASKYEQEKIERILTHINRVVEQVVLDNKMPVAEIEIITENEKKQIVNGFNHTADNYQHGKTFTEVFEAQVLKTPDQIAVIYGQLNLTYKTLNEQANQLARYLAEYAIKGSRIPVLMEPSIDLLICMLGIFKAGMIYVPINIDAPLARIADNIADLDARILITKAIYINGHTDFYDKIIEADVEHIIFYDDRKPGAENINLFKTYRIAAELAKGEFYELSDSIILNDGQRNFTASEIAEKVNCLANLIFSETGRSGDNFALLLSNPVLRIAAMLSLRGLQIPFQVLESDEEVNNVSIENVSVLISENSYNHITDSLLWETKTLRSLILLDDYDAASNKKQDAFKKIWNHVAEDTTEAINDYGWSSSYTGKSFSLAEMEEYVNNFKRKLEPYLNSGCRVLEIGCGHGILLFELAPRVGYYHATDLAGNILQKNRERLQRAAINNVHLEALAASEIKNVCEKDFDVIVCSSVVHYFPDTIYLETLIKDSIALINEEGIIYLDDLLDLNEKQNLIESTREYKRMHPGDKVKTDWTNDLFVGRDFFEFIKEKYPEIIEWECSTKTGRIENELTMYRYDVLIKINKTAPVYKKQQSIKQRFSHVDMAEKNPKSTTATLMHPEKYLSSIPDNMASINELRLYGVDNMERSIAAEDISYIIYTSGTTGKPKGAMIHHGGMLNHLYAKIKDLSITEKDTVAQTAPPSFDISIWQFLACLLTGGRTYIIDREKVFEPRLLLKELHKGEVTIFESVPSLLTTILDELPKDHKNLLGQLRWMVPTGEQLGTALVRKWYASFPYIKLMNAYGPTEASDDVTHYVVEYPVEGQSIIPIGKPIRNIHVYVLDEYLNLCPVGVKGQLCVSGIGVGKGYWRDEEKTKQAFVSNPLKNKPDPINYNTIYKTGDTGYYLENGNIVCLGRIDNQVKVRGFRIELGEIESVLSQYGPVQEAVVIAKEQGEDKYLVAYYVAQSELDPDELKNYLATKLVDYMIPSYYVQLKKIPLTPNGKLDKKALPDPRMILGNDYAPPTNDVEKKLAEIWSEVLQIPKEIISVKAGFFELGGHSLKATVLVNKIQKYFDVEVPLKEIFNKQSIESLADYLITVRQTDSEIESESTMIEIAV